MKLLADQEKLLFALKKAVKGRHRSEIVYKSEWLGYLPFGQYHWLEVEGKHIQFTSESLKEDLVLLSELGLLKKVRESQINEEDIHVYYEFHAK